MRERISFDKDDQFQKIGGKRDYLNEGEDDQMAVEGYKSNNCHQIVSWCGIVLSLGILRLIYYWLPKFHLKATHERCSLREATKILVLDSYENHKTYYIKKVNQEYLNDKSMNNYWAFDNQAFTLDNKKTKGEMYNVSIRTKKGQFPSNGISKDMREYRFIIVKKLRYIWVDEKDRFLKLSGLGSSMKNSDMHNLQLNIDSQEHQRKLYGRNEVNIQVQSYTTLLLIEVLSPYYFFQVVSLVVWILDNYAYYAIAISIVNIISIGLTVVQTHQAQVALKKIVESSNTNKTEILDSNKKIVEASYIDLVPGDRIILPDNEEYTVPCDAVILSGSCIVQESMLTGESVPLTKTSLPDSNEEYEEKENSNHLLFNGTKVIQTRREEGKRVEALVIRTGFTTAKGGLVRAILYPPPVDYIFENSVYTFINLSALGGLILSCAVCVWLAKKNMTSLNIFIRSFELLTMVIPAAIPGSLTLSKLYALKRFRNHKIACINPKVINVAGSSNCVCFDKTGTITEDGLDVWGVVPAVSGWFKEPNKKPSTLENNNLKLTLATCHSLSLNKNKLVGDPLDIKMFESTNWVFEDDASSESYLGPIVYSHLAGGKDCMTIRLLHQNQFVSNLQRMSVVTQRSDSGALHLYCKGSPEMIASLSVPDSVPGDLEVVLNRFTKKGYRVIGIGYKQLEGCPVEIIRKRPRTEFEYDLEFLGLLILENKVKAASMPTIDILKSGQFKITMITGDNMQTAVSVSRECKIIEANDELLEISEQDNKLVCTTSQGLKEGVYHKPDLIKMEDGRYHRSYKMAVSGKAWEIIRTKYQEYLPNILVRTAVFARMTSIQKQQVIMELQALGYCVVMCGDGANDCAALKAAHVGVSLSQAEASVASPLSSANEDISCIPIVVREGRASLSACFGLIKFILCYGYIQLTSALISYGYDANLSNFQYIWEDIFVVIVLSTVFSLTKAYDGKIVPERPTKKLLSVIPILSLLVHTSIFIIFQLVMYFWIQIFPWYVEGPLDRNLVQSGSKYITYNYKNYAIYSISIFQVIIAAVVFSKGYPHRKRLYTNYTYLFFLIVVTILTGFITTYPSLWVQELFIMALPPMGFRYIALAAACVNLLISSVTETFVIEYFISQKIKNFPYFKNKRIKRKYEKALEETASVQWVSNIINTNKKVD